jgi:cysteinyl-tRNA synthetase
MQKPIHILNTQSKEKELFTPIVSGEVSMYHCGPTVYWTQHIGNMRAVVIADLVRRVFEYNGYKVNLVRNYTDVGHLTGDNIGDADSGEDRMEKAAKRENSTPDEIANRYIDIYNKDIVSLGTLPPTSTPRATEYIQEMQSMVSTLLEKGFAYSTPLAIYFDISKAHDYTRLSKQKLENLLTGTGHGDVSDGAKRNAGDFALWFFKAGTHTNALQTWESPFTSPLVENGRGFPGWHIECSAMSRALLGNTLDIHMGGIEHIPVHHTNEIAQSECCNSAPYVHYWIHNEHLLVDGGKMSKSEGTSYSVADIIAKGYSPLVLRYFFLQAHYRSKQNFTWEALHASSVAYKKLVQYFSENFSTTGKVSEKYEESFTSSINDDFNTTSALGTMWELIKDDTIHTADKIASLAHFDKVLGLGLEAHAEAISDHTEDITLPEHIEELRQARDAARTAKNWPESDRIRDELDRHGYTVTDTKEGTKIAKK